MNSAACQASLLWDGKGYHNVHAHTTGNGGNGWTTKVCIINRKQHVEEKERESANSYRR
jgi:hypothetical protein